MIIISTSKVVDVCDLTLYLLSVISALTHYYLNSKEMEVTDLTHALALTQRELGIVQV